MKLLMTLLVLPLCLGCVSDDGGSGRSGGAPSLQHSAGAVVNGDLDTVWRAVASTFRQLDVSADIDEASHTAKASYQGAAVSMRAERHVSGDTILRVLALRDGQQAQDVADKVLTTVQRKLF